VTLGITFAISTTLLPHDVAIIIIILATILSFFTSIYNHH
jgi:hypothetical protein